MDAVTDILGNIPQNGTPAEYVSWFAQALSALFSALMEIFGKIKSIGGEEAAEEGE